VSSAPRGAGLRLLVVDDEEQILELLDLTLTLQGYTVHTEPSGPGALAFVTAHDIDVIVMDVLMSPWDGFETIRRLREARPALPPVVFLSGLNRPEPLPNLGSDVTAEYLVKPFRPSELIAVIERAWANRLH
jgi:CheY-like chemotaxis protein